MCVCACVYIYIYIYMSLDGRFVENLVIFQFDVRNVIFT